MSSASLPLLVILSSAGWCCQSVSFTFRSKSKSNNLGIAAISIICRRYLAWSFDPFFFIHPLPPSLYAEEREETRDDLRNRYGFLSIKRHVHYLYFPSPVCQNSARSQVVSIHHDKVYIMMKFTMPFLCGYHRIDTKENWSSVGMGFWSVTTWKEQMTWCNRVLLLPEVASSSKESGYNGILRADFKLKLWA